MSSEIKGEAVNMADEQKERSYVASDTARDFHADNSYIRGIIGPIGSGKSVASIMEIMIRAQAQEPDIKGFRRTRCAVIRNTMPMLVSTTIKTFQDWIPDAACPIVSRGGMRSGRILEKLADGTFLDCEIIFLALDRPADCDKLLSLELTFFFINEAREVPEEILTNAMSRLARYPAQIDRPSHIRADDWPTFTGGWCDTNPCDTEHWWFDRFVEKQVDNHRCFHQPPAMLPTYEDGLITGWNLNSEGDKDKGIKAGENLKWLKPDYYPKLISGQKEDWIKVMVGAEYGTLSDGRPVFPRFTTSEHVSKKPLEIYRGVQLVLGSDNGFGGVTLFCQIEPNTGMLRVLREYCRNGADIRSFCDETIQGAMWGEFRGMQIHRNYADPATTNNQSITGSNECDEFNLKGIPTEPASTQNVEARITSVASKLEKKVSGIIIDPSCRKLIKAMTGGYKYKRKQTGGSTALFVEKPDKTPDADYADALQYICVSIDDVYRPTALIENSFDGVLITDDTDIAW
jgi:hypothetical protein